MYLPCHAPVGNTFLRQNVPLWSCPAAVVVSDRSTRPLLLVGAWKTHAEREPTLELSVEGCHYTQHPWLWGLRSLDLPSFPVQQRLHFLHSQQQKFAALLTGLLPKKSRLKYCLWWLFFERNRDRQAQAVISKRSWGKQTYLSIPW